MNDQQIIEALAEKLMGRKIHKRGLAPEWNPLTDPAACALVLDEIERRGWIIHWIYDWDAWSCHLFERLTNLRLHEIGKHSNINRYRAVCLAALRALGVEV